MSLLTGAPRRATVVALTATELLEVPKAPFEIFLKREPELLERLVDLMEQRASTAALSPENPEESTREQLTRRVRDWFRVL